MPQVSESMLLACFQESDVSCDLEQGWGRGGYYLFHIDNPFPTRALESSPIEKVVGPDPTLPIS